MTGQTAWAPAHREILAALLGDPDVVVTNVAFLAQGWTNLNYRVSAAGQELALRIGTTPNARADAPPNDAPLNKGAAMRRRRELETLCGPAQDLAPELLGYQLPQGHLLTRFVSGPMLQDAPPESAELAELAARLHTSLGDLRRRYDPRRQIETNLARARVAGYRAARDAVAAVENLKLDVEATVGCHNDFNPWNVVRGADRWYVFDWETAGNNDPLYDLVTMFEGLGWSAQARWETLEHYAELTGRAPPSADRLRQFTLLFQLGSYAWAYAECCAGNERAELQTQVETSLSAIAALG